jgi:hypothetical protein
MIIDKLTILNRSDCLQMIEGDSLFCYTQFSEQLFFEHV